jgi:hypothetical protein
MILADGSCPAVDDLPQRDDVNVPAPSDVETERLDGSCPFDLCWASLDALDNVSEAQLIPIES